MYLILVYELIRVLCIDTLWKYLLTGDAKRAYQAC